MTFHMQHMAGVAMPSFLSRVLYLDAATGLAMAIAHTAFPGSLAKLTQIPAGLIIASGLALFPIAALMAWAASRREVHVPAVMIVILGNVGWTIASLLLLLVPELAGNSLGRTYIVAQAAGVLVFAVLEGIALRNARAGDT